jgi:hypothetical protein
MRGNCVNKHDFHSPVEAKQTSAEWREIHPGRPDRSIGRRTREDFGGALRLRDHAETRCTPRRLIGTIIILEQFCSPGALGKESNPCASQQLRLFRARTHQRRAKFALYLWSEIAAVSASQEPRFHSIIRSSQAARPLLSLVSKRLISSRPGVQGFRARPAHTHLRQDAS